MRAPLLLLGMAILTAIVVHTPTVFAQTATSSSPQAQIDANTQEIATLNQEIAQYQAELQQADASKKTLQGAINALNLQTKELQAQITATQKQINTTQLQIQQLGTGIANAQQEIAASQAGIGEEFRSIQEAEDEAPILQILSSNSLSDAWGQIGATLDVQNAIQDKVDTLQTQKTSLTNSQTASQQKKAALAAQQKLYTSQQASLKATIASKNQLLAETNANEATYEKLLAQAQAQLQSFSNFTKSAGGSGLLANQTSCDAWGCYYNQRDASWGDDALDGTQYNLASDGCLITAMAMVITHYGYTDVTPVSINSNASNFAAYYPAYLLYTISVDGVSATRKTATIDATLSTGNPVIVGLNAYGGTHYVVLISGSNGNYIMRDPYIANGKDISFTAHYSLRSIFGISKVVISG